jgi:hypothetical protein
MQAHHRPRTAHWMEPGGNPSIKPTTSGSETACTANTIDLVRFELSLQRNLLGWDGNWSPTLRLPRPRTSYLWDGTQRHLLAGFGGPEVRSTMPTGITAALLMGIWERWFGPRTRTASRRLGLEKCRGNSGQSSPGPTAKWTAAWPSLTALTAISIDETARDEELGGSTNMGLEVAAEPTLAPTDLWRAGCHGRDQRRWV